MCKRILIALVPVLSVIAIGCGNKDKTDATNTNSNGGSSANAPAAAPALDLSTPKSTAMIFATAVTNGDSDTAKKVALTDDKSVKIVDTMSALISGMNQFKTAAHSKFGDKADDMLKPFSDMDLVKQVDSADFKIDGDKATMTPKATGSETPQNPISLKKVGSDWKVDMISDPKIAEMMGEQPQMQKMADMFKSLAGDINSGKLKSVQDVQVAMAKTMNPDMPDMPAIPTTPTTMPSIPTDGTMPHLPG